MTPRRTPEEITARLHQAMDDAVGLTSDDISNIESLIQVGEWLVAFETLCTQIYEWEISLPARVVRNLEELGATIGASKELTDHLWEDTTDG